MVRATRIHKIVPSKILKKLNLLTGDFYFGIRTESESKLLKSIIEDTDNEFLVWAINEIMNWKKIKTESDKDLIHIQGDKDRIFPNRNLKDVIWIKDGGHFMVFNKAEEISSIINNN